MTDLDHRVLDRRPRTEPDLPPARDSAPGGRGWSTSLWPLLLVLLIAAVGGGAWRHYQQHTEILAIAEQRRDFVPTVRVAAVKASPATMSVVLPATTSPFASANIYARASGYVAERNVDIGSRVKTGDTLAIITAPEIDHQIAQAQATIAQTEASHRQTEANRDLAHVTWDRDATLVKQGWVTQQQGDTDRLTFAAQSQAAEAGEAAIKSQQAQLLVLRQQKAYQQIVAPFDGVVTRRNIDVGSLVQADATSGTFMFTITQSDVMRIQAYVPQDAAIGVKPGIGAVVRVPELPGRSFAGTVTRTADALDPATRTLLTEIDVPNPDGTLSPGIYCTVELNIPRVTPSLIVPASAIIFNDDGLHALVADNGVVHSRKIIETRDLGTEIEVASGVGPGDQVVLNPPIDLGEGSKVLIHSSD
ncbi:MAG TPA: efflux RND transporter periplasmic adaptor subunit [Stellaceae bacterium]|nr:efflux RND transporter periplasmic adaptor subunit [Stellaceae bacterium]